MREFNPNQLRRRERYRQNPPLKEAKLDFDADCGAFSDLDALD